MAQQVLTEKNVQDVHEGGHLWPSIDRLVRDEPEAAQPGLKPAQVAGVHSEVRMGRAHNESGLIWVTTVFMVLFHVGAIAALFFFSWTNLIVAVVLYIFAINCGIGMGYHRLLVHRGYQVPKAVEYFLAMCGTLSLEGGPLPGWPRTASTISTAIKKATPTRRRKALGGLTWVGSSLARRSTHKPPRWPTTRPISPKIASSFG